MVTKGGVMKKVFLFSLFAVSSLFFVSECQSSSGTMPPFKDKLWRSSFTSVNVEDMLIASGSVVLKGVIILSTSSADGRCGIYNAALATASYKIHIASFIILTIILALLF